MSDIKLTSKEYCESVFVDGPKFDKLSAFVSGPDAQVQGKLTASTGINLNDNTISVDTATSVGTSDLPVTASAVNTKLSSYVNSVSSPDGSITVSKSGSSVTLKANGGGGNYVPLGSYGSYPWGSALPVGGASEACGQSSTATGDNSKTCGGFTTAYGSNSTANGEFNTAVGCGSNAQATCSTAYGADSHCLGSSSFAIGPFVTNMASAGGVLGNSVRNSDNSTIVIGTFSGFPDRGQFTQLYLIAAGSDLSTQYCGGEAGLGYITTQPDQDGRYSWQILDRGTRKLSDLLTDHKTDFTPNLSL